MTRLRPPPRRSHSPACPPTASHATPPASRVWVPAWDGLLIEVPIVRYPVHAKMELDFTAWNAVLPKACKMPKRAEINDFCGLIDRLCEKLRDGEIQPSARIELHAGDEIIRLRLSRPGHWQARPMSAKNQAALGWPSLDKPAGRA